MRVLLDECVPTRLRQELPGHAVRTVVEMGWSGIKNGDLLKLAAAEFDCFLTVDRNLQFQQNISALPIAVMVLHAAENDLESLRLVMPSARVALDTIKPAQLVNVTLRTA